MYFYGASAVGFGGILNASAGRIIESQASSSLSVTGGHSYQGIQNFRAEGFLEVKAAYTTVHGSFDECHNIHTTYASSVIEGLNIADIVTADRIVSRMSVYSPGQESAEPEHSFDITGSYFENLRIAGHNVDIRLATQKLHAYDTFSKLEQASRARKITELQPWGNLDDKGLHELEMLEKEYRGLSGISEVANEWRQGGQQRNDAAYWISAAGHLRLREDLGPESELKGFGSIICIPRVGCVRLAELLVEKTSRQLNMLRVDLESPWASSIAVGCAEVKSRSYQVTSKPSASNGRSVSAVHFPVISKEDSGMNIDKSGGLDLIPKETPDERLLGSFIEDPDFRRAQESLQPVQRRAVLWTAALQTSFMEQRIWQEVEGFQYASVGLANPDVEENAFAVFIYRLPGSGGEEKRMLQVGTNRFPIFVRPSLLQLHAIPDVHPVGGTSTCWARLRKPIRNSETALLTAKHVIGDAPLGASVTTTRGRGRVLAIAPGSIDAALIKPPHGTTGKPGKILQVLPYVAQWTHVHFQGMGSGKVVNTEVIEVWFRNSNHPSLPARIFLGCPGKSGDSGALVLDSQGKGIGIYLGELNPGTKNTEGLCQHLGQAASLLDCELFD